MAKRNKNVSKTIPNGRTLQTRDEFLESGKGKKNIKPNHPEPNDLYRRVVVVDSNRKNEVAVVKLTTKGKNKLPNYGRGRSSFKPIVEIRDNQGNFISIDGVKFKENKQKKDLSKKDVSFVKKKSFVKSNPKTREQNRTRARELKGRQKKNR